MVAIAEMAMAGGVGATIEPPSSLPLHAFLFGEDQARYVLATSEPDAVMARLKLAQVPVIRLGQTGGDTLGDALTVAGAGAISTAELRGINEAWLPGYMARP